MTDMEAEEAAGGGGGEGREEEAIEPEEADIEVGLGATNAEPTGATGVAEETEAEAAGATDIDWAEVGLTGARKSCLKRIAPSARSEIATLIEAAMTTKARATMTEILMLIVFVCLC